MPRADFYILPDGGNIDRFACNITNKIWSRGNRVHLHTQSEQMAAIIDDMLWTFRDISFIPHQLLPLEMNEGVTVTVACDGSFPEVSEVMINLDVVIPDFAVRFDRIVEIVGGDDNDKSHARQRYHQYRQDGYEIHNHKIEHPEANV